MPYDFRDAIENIKTLDSHRQLPPAEGNLEMDDDVEFETGVQREVSSIDS